MVSEKKIPGLYRSPVVLLVTAQKIKFSIKDFFSKCDQIRRKLWIWSHLLKKSVMENLILCAVNLTEHAIKITLKV